MRCTPRLKVHLLQPGSLNTLRAEVDLMTHQGMHCGWRFMFEPRGGRHHTKNALTLEIDEVIDRAMIRLPRASHEEL